MTRIGLFVPSLRGGGAERVMVTLATELARRNYTVDLVLANADGPYLADVPASVNIVNLNSKRVLFAIPKLVRYLNMEKPDCILATLRHANIVAIAAKLLSSHAFQLVIREANTIEAHLKHDSSRKEKVLPFLMKILYRRSNNVIAVSNDVKSDLISYTGLPDTNINVINNPVVHPDLFHLSEEPTNHPWLEPKTEAVIISVGRLSRQKDYQTLIRAFAEFNQQLPAKLIILGEGEERGNLEQLIHDLDLKDRVSMPGFVSNPFCYIKKADAFVLSSLWEGQPNALIQALALGVPCISTDCPGGSREVLQNGQYGALIPPNSPQSLTEALHHILQSGHNSTLDLDNANRNEHLHQAYGIQSVIDQYLKAMIPK